MKSKVLGIILSLALLLMQGMSVMGLEEVVASVDPVDGNTRGIMLLVMLLGFGVIALIGFYVSATEGEENRENQ